MYAYKLAIGWVSIHSSLLFQTGTAENLSLTESDESINLIGTQELKPHFNCPYASHDQDFCRHQPPLVMRSHGEPLATTPKVVTALML